MDKETSSLIKGYIEKAKDKLKIAASLLDDGAYDDAVSRAYYAAFHATSAVLLTEGLSTDTHRGLINLFGLHFIKTNKIGKKYGRYLSNLKDDRETGDYEVFSTIDETVAKKAIVEAKEFVSAIERYLSQQ
ncbi:hypothetical protein A3H38_03115 [candidate division WOR-1 bacterium RIFCSPLOWO2_02_FULL_46_20]|uniref:HEPN domain-containing protein n=1 Tax=candidate division WOR-1 bacterium RIFCSPLOWO2_02_FULL_46_20 TaxID=1802567 RepID=A0A1F4R7Z1_UNCSA|nr:MAG: hypothetical protein A3J44_03980 [candidate division WOR-1 bacterium RIFCSPHIGHO2_02_FULL_45_12]OGC04351.1 MAG: hypothetical protein A3H38_03115 [candidate division WOR-1 bacterium RIFCSPLOWO2_02_FULL_46_20]